MNALSMERKISFFARICEPLARNNINFSADVRKTALVHALTPSRIQGFFDGLRASFRPANTTQPHFKRSALRFGPVSKDVLQNVSQTLQRAKRVMAAG